MATLPEAKWCTAGAGRPATGRVLYASVMPDLLIGLVGSLVGFAGAAIVYIADRNRRERGAIRAVLTEAEGNKLALDVIHDLLGELPVTDSVYRANVAILAAGLSFEDMRTVMTAYTFVPSAERMRLKVRAADPLEGWETTTLASMGRQFADATKVLRRRAYRGKGFGA